MGEGLRGAGSDVFDAGEGEGEGGECWGGSGQRCACEGLRGARSDEWGVERWKSEYWKG